MRTDRSGHQVTEGDDGWRVGECVRNSHLCPLKVPSVYFRFLRDTWLRSVPYRGLRAGTPTQAAGPLHVSEGGHVTRTGSPSALPCTRTYNNLHVPERTPRLLFHQTNTHTTERGRDTPAETPRREDSINCCQRGSGKADSPLPLAPALSHLQGDNDGNTLRPRKKLLE